MTQVLEKASMLNKEVQRLNTERSKMEGMLESSKVAYMKAIEDYKVKYGVELTPENLQSEYNQVYATTLGSVEDLSMRIESISRGDYKKEVPQFNLEPDVAPIKPVEVVPVVEEFSPVGEVQVDEPKKRKPRTKKPKVEPVVEEFAPVKEVANIPVLTPVSPAMSDDEVDLSDMGLDDLPFTFGGSTPAPTFGATPAPVKVEEAGFGGVSPIATATPSFGGFGNPAPAPVKPVEQPFGGFGSQPPVKATEPSFGGFGSQPSGTPVAPIKSTEPSFGGFGSQPKVAPVKSTETGFGGFGTQPVVAPKFGGTVSTQESENASKEVIKETWGGAESTFGSFSFKD